MVPPRKSIFGDEFLRRLAKAAGRRTAIVTPFLPATVFSEIHPTVDGVHGRVDGTVRFTSEETERASLLVPPRN